MKIVGTILAMLSSFMMPQEDAEAELDQATGTSVIIQNTVNAPVSFYYGVYSNGLFSTAPRSVAAGKVIELTCPAESCFVGVQQNGARRVFSVAPEQRYRLFISTNGMLQLTII